MSVQFFLCFYYFYFCDSFLFTSSVGSRFVLFFCFYTFVLVGFGFAISVLPIGQVYIFLEEYRNDL